MSAQLESAIAPSVYLCFKKKLKSILIFREIEGWENPFQPEGPVSQDADLILRLWKGGNLSEDLDSAINQLQVEEERAKTEAEELAAAELEAARLEAEQERAKADKEADSKEKLSVDKANGGSSSNR